MPIVGTVIVAVALLLLSTLHADTAALVLCAYLGLLGLGPRPDHADPGADRAELLPARQVGTATAANNFFRQIGATLGSAVVGSLFAHRLADLLDRAAAGGGRRRARAARTR